MKLVIVESPAKSKTIKKFLGDDYKILASYGHVRDLIAKTGAVEPDNDFKMSYAVLDDSQKHLQQIARALKTSSTLYLATDPDREGEAISWHLCEFLKEKKLLDNKEVCRVVFHEITKTAICEAFDHPRKLSTDLINAQQARRALDYLVGFNLSPLLWRKIKSGLSAGRVQSPALRMIVEREREIEAFKPREYWSIKALLAKTTGQSAHDVFEARLVAANGKKLDKFDINNQDDAYRIRDAIKAHAESDGLHVEKINKKEKKQNPKPPFITSSLQQDAVRKLGLSAGRTMRIAQQLYEGIDLGGESVGLITYMRTDSVTLANDAVQEMRKFIEKEYGADNLPAKPNVYKTKSKNAQEAHEAIRPTSAMRTPAQIRSHLNPDQFRVYELIWKRALACQMTPAIFDTVSVDIACGPYTLRANGSTLRKPGFMQVYTESTEELESSSKGNEKDSQNVRLPVLEEQEKLALNKLDAKQHFTEPPPRYSEASLIKTLEEYGIGRPSTYASIISTLQGRGYAELIKKRFHPTDTGNIVNSFLTQHFSTYVDYTFTANLEDELDTISRGEQDWLPVLKSFWKPFKKQVEHIGESVSRSDTNPAREIGTDPVSKKPVSVRLGRYGPYAQIGTHDDEEKPRFASLTPGLKIDSITLEQALRLFDLPRKLGETPEGEEIQANIGRFGPYVRYGDKFASLREHDPHTITLEEALVVIAAKKEADRQKLLRDFPDAGIQVLKGRWGPYVVAEDKTKVNLGKDCDPASLTLEACQSILAKKREAAPSAKKKKAAPKKKASTKKKTTTKKKAAAKKKTT